MTERYALPEGWVWSTLGEVADYINGRAFKPSEWGDVGRPIIRIQNLTGSTETIHRYSGAVDEKHIVRDGDLLISWSATLWAFIYHGEDAVLNQHIFKVVPRVDKMFLYHLTLAHMRQLQDQVHGTGMQHITKGRFVDSPVPLPPPDEQLRIVAKLEALLHEARRTREALQRISPLAKRLRQSVLAAAFRGQLVLQDPHDEPATALLERIRAERRQRWAAQGKDPARYVEPAPPGVDGLAKLPERWMWATLAPLLEMLQYGTSVKADASPPDGVPVLRMGNLLEGRITYQNLKWMDPMKEKLDRYRLQKGDILINRTNSPELVGKCAEFERDDLFVFASYLIRLRTDPNALLPKYLVHVINSPLGRQHIVDVKHQVAGQANINSDDIRRMPIPLSPLAEQRRIVARIEALFAQADVVEAAVARGLRQVEQFEQSALARAFRGELVGR